MDQQIKKYPSNASYVVSAILSGAAASWEGTRLAGVGGGIGGAVVGILAGIFARKGVNALANVVRVYRFNRQLKRATQPLGTPDCHSDCGEPVSPDVIE